MALIPLRKPLLNSRILLTAYKFSSATKKEPTPYSNNRTFFTEKDYKIELVDDEAWRVSTGLAQAWRSLGTKGVKTIVSGEAVDSISKKHDDQDFDEIEDMRIRGSLCYKLERDSKEFEEYSFDFHRKKSWKDQGRTSDQMTNKDERKEMQKDNSGYKFDKAHVISHLNEMERNIGKKLRTPTFNQLTDPYHEPFCLDIYISKASVRACIVHRATSNVVVVAHSISKDLKFDLGSTRNAAACKAVGEVLAQRALADDIHNVVYTPRKGDKLEGKLQIVLDSLINNGVIVKVKIKQRHYKKARLPPIA